MQVFDKVPEAVLDYEWDWVDWLSTDTIKLIAISCTAGLVIDSSSLANGKVAVWVSGGTLNLTGIVKCFIETNEGRKEALSIIVNIVPLK